ncbi:MAG TPA: hypothetical protein VJT67_12820 [Longimicrobiaceae bacterium]|nr:hypothetical protein [Longimicrobiaceae bacterium]
MPAQADYPQPTPAERLRRRRNVVMLLTFTLIAFGLALYPSVCSYVAQPQGYWPRVADAPRTGTGALPALVPASATEVHTRSDPRGNYFWARFTYAQGDHDRITAGLRRLSLNEARALPVSAPAFTPWWTINERTMLGRAGDRLEVYEVAEGSAWLVLDPASRTGYYWRHG